MTNDEKGRNRREIGTIKTKGDCQETESKKQKSGEVIE